MNERPSERLQRHIDNDTLLRHEWGDGYARACLLGAIEPKCSENRAISPCPASLLPPWFANMVLDFDDRGSPGLVWKQMVQRFQRLLTRIEATPLSDEAWARARLRSLHGCLLEARSVVPKKYPEVRQVLDDVLKWLDEGAPDAQREQTQRAANNATYRWGGYTSPGRAISAAEGVFDRDLCAVGYVASCVARCAELSGAATSETKWHVWDRLTDMMLDVVEKELDACQPA